MNSNFINLKPTKNSYKFTPWCFGLKHRDLWTATQVYELYRYAFLKCKNAS